LEIDKQLPFFLHQLRFFWWVEYGKFRKGKKFLQSWEESFRLW
jgi:hypothetical protein